jgi:hypothetical protein
MKLDLLLQLPDATCAVPPPPDASVSDAFTSDLLSDVMGHAPSDSVLITIQAHATTIAVSTVADIRAILICSSRPLPSDMVEAARRENIGLYRTSLDQFHASVAVHSLLANGTLPA